MTNFNNQTEFILSNDFFGFTTIQNYILDDERVTNNALGLYMRIVRYQNNPNHKIYLKGLITEVNKRTKVTNAMNELIRLGYISREEIREKGRFKGYKYKVYMKPIEVPSPCATKVSTESRKTAYGEADNGKTATNKYNRVKNKIGNKSTTVAADNKTDEVKENKKIVVVEDAPKVEDVPKEKNEVIAADQEVLKAKDEVAEKIEQETHLKLTACQKKVVSKWELARAAQAIKLFNELEGIYFSLLQKIYKENQVIKNQDAAEPKAHAGVPKKIQNYNNLGENGRDNDFDVIEQLERLKNDLMLGLITKDEYDKQVKNLIGEL